MIKNDEFDAAPEEEIEEELEDDGYCTACAGTGEGRYAGTSCPICKGRGVVVSKADPDDFDEPEPLDWRHYE